jgi:Cu+-exporting ATPase
MLDPATAKGGRLEHAGTTQAYCSVRCRERFEAGASVPTCGKALEPRTVSLDEAPNRELRDMTRHFWASAALLLTLVRSSRALR